jgi:hypothetical protein
LHDPSSFDGVTRAGSFYFRTLRSSIEEELEVCSSEVEFMQYHTWLSRSFKKIVSGVVGLNRELEFKLCLRIKPVASLKMKSTSLALYLASVQERAKSRDGRRDSILQNSPFEAGSKQRRKAVSAPETITI